MTKILEVNSVSSGYGKKQVLYDISFSVEEGEVVLLIGNNGSGKSTLLKTIYGLLKPWKNENGERGAIFFNGENITGAEPSILIKRGLVYLPQKDNYFDNLDVESNLEVSGMTITDKRVLRKRIDNVYELFPALWGHRKRIPMKLSGGERQMMIFGMAVLHSPRLILLDEPTLNLSPLNAGKILDMIPMLSKTLCAAVVFVEHKIRESTRVANRMARMSQGQIVEVVKDEF